MKTTSTRAYHFEDGYITVCFLPLLAPSDTMSYRVLIIDKDTVEMGDWLSKNFTICQKTAEFFYWKYKGEEKPRQIEDQKITYAAQDDEKYTLQDGKWKIYEWDGDRWLEEKWQRDQESIAKGETPRRWLW